MWYMATGSTTFPGDPQSTDSSTSRGDDTASLDAAWASSSTSLACILSLVEEMEVIITF